MCSGIGASISSRNKAGKKHCVNHAGSRKQLPLAVSHKIMAPIGNHSTERRGDSSAVEVVKGIIPLTSAEIR